jgi:predicted metal-dependent hydrolase
MVEYDPLYVQFIYYFNIKRDYYECHEVMEQLWLENARSQYYQGLLQVAVGLYHHQQNNVSGAIKLFTAACEKLNQYPAIDKGIDLQKLRFDSIVYLNQLMEFNENQFRPYDINILVLDQLLQTLINDLVEKKI